MYKEANRGPLFPLQTPLSSLVYIPLTSTPSLTLGFPSNPLQALRVVVVALGARRPGRADGAAGVAAAAALAPCSSSHVSPHSVF